ncbi:hypothetical protein [Pedobacter sp. UC225_65]|uniref:hypothetical protein n=1 Tax=Pedobacter sp. UC225_65 TaxID=3350173 RepID=UPI0036735D83
METKYRLLVWFFTAVMVITIAGFFKSYIKFLPDTDKYPIVIHIHFIAFVFWLALMVVQPILIRRKKYDLHHRMGKILSDCPSTGDHNSYAGKKTNDERNWCF